MKDAQRKKHASLINGMRYAQAIRYCLSLLKNEDDVQTRAQLALAYDQAATVARSRGKGYRRLAELAEKAIEDTLAASSAPEHFHIRGIVRLHAGKHALALADFRKAKRLRGDPRYLVSIANALRQLGRSQEALRAYRLAKRSGKLPNKPLDYNIAQILDEIGRTGDSLRMIKKNLARKPKNAFERQVKRQFIQLRKRIIEQ